MEGGTVTEGGWKEGEDKDEACLFVTVTCVLTQSASSVGCTVGVYSLLFVDRVGYGLYTNDWNAHKHLLQIPKHFQTVVETSCRAAKYV